MKRFALVALVALALPTQAFAHATLYLTQPAFKQRLAASPARIVLHFDQGVKAFPDSIKVLTASGRVVSGTAGAGASANDVVVPVRRLAKGGYTVRWHALSADGHSIGGVFTFGNAPRCRVARGRWPLAERPDCKGHKPIPATRRRRRHA